MEPYTNTQNSWQEPGVPSQQYGANLPWVSAQTPRSELKEEAVQSTAERNRKRLSRILWWVTGGTWALAELLTPILALVVVGSRTTSWAVIAALAWIQLILFCAFLLLLIVTPLVSSPSPGRRVGALSIAMALALLSAIIYYLAGAFALSLTASLTAVIAPIPAFFVWALSRPLRGVGYVGAAFTLVAVFGTLITRGLAGPILIPAAVLGSVLLSRVSERRGTQNAMPAQPWAPYPASGVGATTIVQQAVMLPDGRVVPFAQAMLTTRTNTLAILALIFGLLGGWLGIVFGHIALSQIKRTGEQGRGMAIAGLVLGYISASVVVVYLIMLFAVLS